MANTQIPGLIYPSVQAMPAGNPRDSAILAQQESVRSQVALAKAVGGALKKNKYHGGNSQGNNIVVPQFQMQYKPTGTDGQDPNSIIKSGSQISTQSAANSVYDKYALQNGGKKKRSTRRSRGRINKSKKTKNYLKKNKKGGNNLSWDCYNGGKGKNKNKTKRVKK
jgi:hypothetical protein